DLELLFGALAFGQVARDFGVAQDLPGRSPDWIDDSVGPEARTVLADAPAFGFKLPFAPCGLKCSCRNSRRLICLRIEPREMVANDFGRFVSLEASRTRIPA